MTARSTNPLNVSHVLFPLSLLAFVVFLLMAFQTSQVFRDRDALHQAKTQLDKPVDESQKLQAQLDALAVGTQKLANQGDKNAQAIIDKLKAAGITVTMPAAGGTPTATAPGVAPTTSSASAP